MQKKHKNIEKMIIKALTIACKNIKKETKGFQWLTHEVDYKNINSSLKIYCIFDSQKTINTLNIDGADFSIVTSLTQELENITINIGNIKQQIIFTTKPPI